MNSKETRNHFLNYFKNKKHTLVPSAPIVPQGDASLLFNSAGMVPFKPYFLGLKTDLSRAVSCQKCFRTTDIDSVGTTARHLTFFEMLGNFSFGDYFKEEAIVWAWDYLVKELGLEPERLYVSVYQGNHGRDDEAYALWSKILPQNIREGRIKLMDDKDNFWSMGPTGPCGPCSEIYYDFGPSEYKHLGCSGVGCDCDRYIEIWNLVFTQFDKQPDGSLKPLAKKNIDTGMGLERLCAVLQGKKTTFETDLFTPIMNAAIDILKVPGSQEDASSQALRVIGDHSRAAVMLLNEGVVPSNEGRGYVLRRIIRRSARYGRQLGSQKPFMHELVPTVAEIFDGIYPDIAHNKAAIINGLKAEEERFLETLESGEKHINGLLAKSSGVIDGSEAFSLYETYGFPLELTVEIAKGHGKTVDVEGFEKAQAAAKELAKSKWKGSGESDSMVFAAAHNKFGDTQFTGYNCLAQDAKITGLLNEKGAEVDVLDKDSEGYIILDQTPFYAESGGQVGDTGLIFLGEDIAAEISDTQKPVGGLIVHKAQIKLPLKKDDKVFASVSIVDRKATAANHTATHLINAALKTVFGEHVHQAGSFVAPDRFRFDYTINRAPTKEELERIEEISNAAVAHEYKVSKQERPLSDAHKFGATMLLGEKYSDPARFVLINDDSWDNASEHCSLELCGGTHVDNTAEIITVKILKDSSLSAGVRRIEGTAGHGAVNYFKKITASVEDLAKNMSVKTEDLAQRVEKMLENENELKAEIKKLKNKLASGGNADDIKTFDINGKLKLVWAAMDDADKSSFRVMSDTLRAKNGGAVVAVTSANGDKFSVILTLGENVKDVDLPALAKAWGEEIGAKLGGRADFVQGGGKDPQKLAQYISALEARLKRLS